jgi:hypothetical protein
LSRKDPTMANQFDDFSKSLAGAGSRRHALKVIGLGAVSAVAGAFGVLRGRSSVEASRGCLAACRRKRGAEFNDCVRVCTCKESGGRICGEGSNRVCCPPWTRCSSLNETNFFSVNGGSGVFCVPIPQTIDGDCVPTG